MIIKYRVHMPQRIQNVHNAEATECFVILKRGLYTKVCNGVILDTQSNLCDKFNMMCSGMHVSVIIYSEIRY
jgi:hypothetical protein